MIDKKDYTDLYRQADLMYANEISRLMAEMKINSLQISNDGMDVVSLRKDEDDLFPKAVMSDGKVMDIVDIRGIGERLYNIVYNEYQNQYKETVIDKIKRMDFDTLVQFLQKNGIISITSIIFRMNDNNVWRSLMDEHSPIQVIKQINDAYVHDDFEYDDGYVWAEKDNRQINFKSFGSVSRIVKYFEDEVNEKCSDENVA